MRIWIPVPEHLLRPLVLQVAEWHGLTAADIDAAVRPDGLVRLRDRDADLAEMVETLQHWTDPADQDGAGDIRVSAERQILSHAILHLIRKDVRALDHACAIYPTGANDVPDLDRIHHQLGELLGLFRQTELLTGAVPRDREAKMRRHVRRADQASRERR
jgi:hypothetical protein